MQTPSPTSATPSSIRDSRSQPIPRNSLIWNIIRYVLPVDPGQTKWLRDVHTTSCNPLSNAFSCRYLLLGLRQLEISARYPGPGGARGFRLDVNDHHRPLVLPQRRHRRPRITLHEAYFPQDAAHSMESLSDRIENQKTVTPFNRHILRVYGCLRRRNEHSHGLDFVSSAGDGSALLVLTWPSPRVPASRHSSSIATHSGLSARPVIGYGWSSRPLAYTATVSYGPSESLGSPVPSLHLKLKLKAAAAWDLITVPS